MYKYSKYVWTLNGIEGIDIYTINNADGALVFFQTITIADVGGADASTLGLDFVINRARIVN